MRQGKVWFVGAVASALGFCAGCSGGGGGAASPAAVAGQWLVWMSFNGREIGPYATCLTQAGGDVGGVGISGTVSGSGFSVTNDNVSGLQVVFQGTVSGTGASGTVAITGSSISGTFRMQLLPTTGDLSASGNVSGQALAVTSGTAWGRRGYSDQAMTQLADLEVGHDDGVQRAHLTFGAAGFAVGSLAVGSGGLSVTLSYETDAAAVDVTATGGSVTVAAYGPSGTTGTYALTFPGGGTASGSFDVAWDYDAFLPP